jgi:ketosteroid isomerase-like protein
VKQSGDWLKVALLVVAALGTATPVATAKAQPATSAAPAENEIRRATTHFYEALNTALQGNFEPLSAIWSHSPDVSDFSADGGEEFGWNAIHDHIRNVARLYPSGNIHGENVRVVGDGNIAYSVVTETGQMRSPDGAMVKFSQRATNIFRREGGAWKLVHHHADGSANGAAI